MKNLYDEFQNPPVQFRGKPFWSWNGKLDKEELIRQIHTIKDMGFGGFFMHSRTGLETEYLGEEWFELINACADEAEMLGMEAWLYDEDRWPSGITGGKVTGNPEFRMKSIKLEVYEDSSGFKWEDGTIAAFSCVLCGDSVYEYRRIFDYTSVREYKLKQILVFKVIEMSKHSFYNGFTYVDTLNREATEKFIELTHEKYKQKCGDRIGRSIKGIFTDEPHRGTLMDVFGAGNDGDIYRIPWTGKFPEVFAAKFGYDIIEKLPELFFKYNGINVSQVKWHYVETLQQMFLDNFAKPIYEWCSKNNMLLTGHVLHEDSLTAQTAMNGSVMRYYEYMDYPGVDLLAENNKVYWVAKQLSSAARQLGKEWLLSELYGCTGWQMDFEAHKAIGDWQALFGINLRCPHLSWYTMEGEAKRDYPASILHQSTWWKEYRFVEDYFSRLGLFLKQGRPYCEVLVLNPVESVWSQVKLGWAEMLSAKSEEIMLLEEKYRDIFHWLSGSHIDFDYGDEDMVSRLYEIDMDERGSVLKIGEAGYKVVVIAGISTIRSSTIDILKKFVEAGGKVIIAGKAPSYIDAVEGEFPGALLKAAEKIEFEKEALIKAVKKYLKYFIYIKDMKGEPIEDIFCQLREDAENKYIVLLNTNRQKDYDDVMLEMNFSGYVEELDCSSGNRYGINSSVRTAGDENIKISTDFEASGEKCYLISGKPDPELLPKQAYGVKEEIQLNGPYDYRLEEPNVCVLDMAEYRFGEGEWQEELEILKVDRKVRAEYGLPFRGGEMLQPWFSGKQGFDIKGKVSIRFGFYIEEIPEGIVELVLEKPENFIITINSERVSNKGNNDKWVDICFHKLPISPEILKKGLNTVELSVDFHEGINLEAIYLLGSFGVRLDGSKKVLVKLPDRINADDLTGQGLPFYSGKVSYNIRLPRNRKDGERVLLSIDEFEGACLKVVSDEKKDLIVAWRPYEAEVTDYITEDNKLELMVVLTRRNTFGPLHQIPLKAIAYGPDSFITEGEEFSKEYMLYPSGLLKNPKIKFLEVENGI